MPDLNGDTPSNETNAGPTLSDEITRSLGTVFQRHASERPTEISTEVDEDVVRCVFKDAVASFDAGPASESDGPVEEPRVTNTAGYRNAAIAAVAKATNRRVVGFIPKHDKKTDVATATFLLEQKRRKN